jgi:protein-disulfide isomerase
VETEPALIQQYVATGKVKLVYRHLTQLGDISQLAAEASECAADQDRFWEMRFAIYREQATLFSQADARTALLRLASDLQLNGTPFVQCLNAGTHRSAVEQDFQAAEATGIRSRPVFEIGDQRLIGAQQLSQFQQIIDAALPR